MSASGRLKKHFPHSIGSLFLSGNLGDNRPFQHIGQDEAGMMMRLADSSRRVIHMTDRHLPIVHGEVWQVVFEEGAVCLRGLSLRGAQICVFIWRAHFA